MEIYWLFLLGTVDALLDFGCIFFFGLCDLRIVRGVRIDTFSAILRQEVAFFDNHNTGELSSRLTSDCGMMASDLTWFFRFSIESVVRITGITTYMFIRSPKLGAVALSIVPLIAAVNKVYGQWLSDNAKKVQDALAAANSVSQESLACIRTVVAFASENLELSKYVEKIDEQFRLNVRQTYFTGIYYMFVSTFLINTVVQGVLLLIGSYMIQRNTLTSEVLLAFMLYQGQLQNEMMNLFNSYSSLIKSTGAGDKVFEILDRSAPPPATGSNQVLVEDDEERRNADEEGEVTENILTEAVDDFVTPMRIEFKNVNFFYPSRGHDNMVLKGLDLVIPEGSTLALVGPSGKFKSEALVQ
jgi:ATP-binding cassette subfamily B (MDR/TAP) protein 9